MKQKQYESVPFIHNLAQTADHIDVKVIEGEKSLREFLAGMISYQPRWMTFLYAIRWGFVRLLGMKQEGLPQAHKLNPSDISMQTGGDFSFFKVEAAEEDQFFVASASESHLSAYIGVVAIPLDEDRNRFEVITIVKYNNWAGPIYFNVIRPFHHIVVGQMARAGVGT